MASKILCFTRSRSRSPPQRRAHSGGIISSSSAAKYDTIGSRGSVENGGGGGGPSCVGSLNGGGTPRTSSSTNSTPTRGSEETPLLLVSSHQDVQQRQRGGRRRLRLLGHHRQREEQRPPVSPQRQEDLKMVHFWRQQQQQLQQLQQQSPTEQQQQPHQQHARNDRDPAQNSPTVLQASSRPLVVPDTIETSVDPPNFNDLSMDSLEDHVQLDQVAQVWKQKGNVPPIATVLSDDSCSNDNDNNHFSNGAFPTFSLEESQELLHISSSSPTPPPSRHRPSGSSSTNDNSLLASSCSQTATHDTIFTYDDDDDRPAPHTTPEQQQQWRFTAAPESPDLVVVRSESYVSSTSSRVTSRDSTSPCGDGEEEEEEILRHKSDTSVLLLDLVGDPATGEFGKYNAATYVAKYTHEENSEKCDAQENVHWDSRLPPATAPMRTTSPSPKLLHPYATPQRQLRTARQSPSTPDSDSVYLKSITTEPSASPVIGQRPGIDEGDVPPVAITNRSGVFTPSHGRKTTDSQPEEAELVDAIVAAMEEKQYVQQHSELDSHRIHTSHGSAWSLFNTAVASTGIAAAVVVKPRALSLEETKLQSEAGVSSNNNNKDRSSITPLPTPRSTTATTLPLKKPAHGRGNSGNNNSTWLLSPSARDSPLVQFHAAQQNIPVIQHHRRTYSADVLSGGASERRRERHQHKTLDEESGNTQPSLWSLQAEPANIEQQLLGLGGGGGGGGAAIFPAKLFEAQQELEFQNAQDDDEEDRLSDVPSSVDDDTKQRYFQVCRMLKAALIEKKPVTASPLDQSLIESILSEPDFSQGQPIQSRKTYSQPQPQSQNVSNDSTLHHRSALPQQLSSDVWSSNDVAPSSVGSSAFMDTFGFDMATGIQPQVSSLVPSVSPEPLQNQSIDNVDRPPLQVPGSYPLQRIKNTQEHQQQPPLISPLASEDDRSRAALSDLSSALHSGYPFKVLGLEQHNQRPSILTPAMMEALRGFFPVAVSEENFWLKYSSELDGDSIFTLLDRIRPCRHTVLCLETTDGHVFGAFCSTPWRVQSTWYGSGEAFLWRLKHPRAGSSPDYPRQQQPDNHEIEIYPYTGEGGDNMIQYCTEHSLAVGGAHDWYSVQGGGSPYQGGEPPGIGLLIDGDLKGGETNSCTTFANPRLGDRTTPLSNEFDIAALEVWTLTPCTNVSEAQDLEMHHAFRRQMAEGE